MANPITVVVGTTEGESASSGFTVVGDSNTHYYYDLKMEITNNKLFDMPAAGGGFRATIFGVGIYDHSRRMVSSSEGEEESYRTEIYSIRYL